MGLEELSPSKIGAKFSVPIGSILHNVCIGIRRKISKGLRNQAHRAILMASYYFCPSHVPRVCASAWLTHNMGRRGP